MNKLGILGKNVPVKVLALDYGSRHTGVAVSDPTGSIVRPLDEIEDAGSERGLEAIAARVAKEGAELVVVGMPLTLRGEEGSQAKETAAFIEKLAARLDIAVEAYDERFTSSIAAGRGGNASRHSIAACCLLEDFLQSQQRQ